MQIQEGLQTSPAVVTELKCPLFNTPNMMDLCNRINCWRLDVDACSPYHSAPATFQSRGSMSSLSSSTTRVRSNARSRPYSSHPRRSQSFYVIDFQGPVGFTSEFDDRPTRTRHEPASVPELEPLARVPDCTGSSRVSLKTPSIREVPTGHGLDLPHPERNPLVCLSTS